MANVKQYLEQILKARFGKDVRQSIHDSIDAINTQVTESEAGIVEAATAAQTAADNASTAASNAQQVLTDTLAAQAAAEAAAINAEAINADLVQNVSDLSESVNGLSENVIALNDDLAETMSNVSAHDTAIADLTVEQSTQASNISNLDIEVAKKANKTEIPSVNNGTLTIQKNGSNVVTFSANQSGNATANITTPDGMISDAYNANTTYVVGQYCIYNNSLWRCKTQCKGQTPAENSYWTKRNLGQEIKQINTDLSAINSNLSDILTQRTELLSSDSLMQNTEYTLSDSYKNYKFIQLQLLNSENPAITDEMLLPVMSISSNSNKMLNAFYSTDYYMTVGMVFTGNNKVKITTINKANWNLGRLIISGIR